MDRPDSGQLFNARVVATGDEPRATSDGIRNKVFFMERLSLKNIMAFKRNGKKITMLTAYDYPLAVLLDQAGVDIILVGDSLANVVLGLDSTKKVNIEMMLHHTKAVRRGVKRAFLIGDMPYSSLHHGAAKAVRDAKRFIKEAGCDAVKVEWFSGCLALTKKVIAAGIPVMSHIGLTPQTADRLGGMKVQGREAKSASMIMEQAKALELAGCFSIVLECVPDRVAGLISKSLRIPTISIGAGPLCDGQVLVTHDLLGIYDRLHPKFVKQYAEIDREIIDAVQQYVFEVREGAFPAAEHTYHIKDEEWELLKKGVGGRGTGDSG